MLQDFECCMHSNFEGLRSTDLIVMVGTALFTLPLLWRGAVLNRAEGAFLVAGYMIYLWSLLRSAGSFNNS